MKYNKNFAKLKADNTPEWGPIPLIVVTHHHEEWDETIVDPDTGEERTEHKTYDYDTSERKLRPTAADYRSMEFLPVIYNPPSEPPPAGYHYVESGYVTSQDGESIVCEYELVVCPSEPIMNDVLSGETFPTPATLHELIGATEKLWTCLGGNVST